MAALTPSSDGEQWSGGPIYDPNSGSTYRCTARLEGPNRLRIRGSPTAWPNDDVDSGRI